LHAFILPLKAGEAFLLLDAGGGTVDATTFIVANEDPLRLKREGVDSDGMIHSNRSDSLSDLTSAILCGSSILNKHYEDLLKRKLEDEENYFKENGVDLNMIVDSCVQDFENLIKRNYDIMAAKRPILVFIHGLRDDPGKGFAHQHLRISPSVLLQLTLVDEADRYAARR
jgi:hypothetical protein